MNEASDSWIGLGVKVRIKPEHRHRYHDGSTAAKGEVLVITGVNGNAWGIGPKFLDYAYSEELEPA